MSFEAAFQDGLTAVKAGKGMIARLQFEQVAELASDFAPGWLWLAWTSDTPEQAEAHLRKALELDESNQLVRAFLEVTTALKDFEVDTDYSNFSISGTTQQSETESASAVETTETPAVDNVVSEETPTETTEQTSVEQIDAAQTEAGLAEASQPESEEAVSQEAPEQAASAPALETPAEATSAQETSVQEPLVQEPLVQEAPAAEVTATVQPEQTSTTEQPAEACQDVSLDAPQQPPAPVEQPVVVQTPSSDVVDLQSTAPVHEEFGNVAADVQSLSDEIQVEIQQTAGEGGQAVATASQPASAGEQAVVAEEQSGEDQSGEGKGEDTCTDTLTIDELRKLKADIVSSGITADEQQETATTEASVPSTGGPSAGSPSSTQSSVKGTVLVVDDSPTVRKIVTMTLEADGYEVVTAEDGVDATKVLVNFSPNLILLDINMPRMGGYKLCKLVKSHPDTSGIPVVMLSGKDGLFDKLRGKLVGCDEYISKPFESEELLKCVREHINVVTA